MHRGGSEGQNPNSTTPYYNGYGAVARKSPDVREQKARATGMQNMKPTTEKMAQPGAQQSRPQTG